jgi:hypothetical protein
MRASVGDRIVTASGVVGGAVRDGVVTQCPHDDGSPPYRVRWSDTDEESLVFPGPDTLVRPDGAEVPDEAPRSGRSVTWRIQVTLVESAGSTTAEAVLVAGPPEHGDLAPLRSVGHARKAPDDDEVPVIGDEVAAGRALRRLADALLGQAEGDITATTGQKGRVHA